MVENVRRMRLNSHILMILLLPVVWSGCDRQPYQTVGGRQAARAANLSKEQLRAALDAFGEHTVSSIRRSAIQMTDPNSSHSIQKVRLVARVNLLQAFQTMLQQEDPMVAFVETWGLSRRLKHYLEDGQGSLLYGSSQTVIVDASKKIESEIESIGRQFLDAETFDETRSLIEKFSNQNPINGSFTNLLVYAVETVPGEPGPFTSLIGVPMAPFKAVEGVDRTASSIYGVRNSMDRFTDTVSDLPEAARWQLLLLLTDMENVEAIRKFLDSTSSFSKSSEELVALLNEYPEKIRQQASLLMTEMDNKQAAFQTTLNKAGEAAATIEKATLEIRRTIDAANITVKEINQTAEVWQNAADATSGALGIIKGWTDAPRKQPSTFKITDYRDVAVETTRAAQEIRSALAEADGKTTALIDHLAWRSAQVILLLFVLICVYRFMFARIRKEKKIRKDLPA